MHVYWMTTQIRYCLVPFFYNWHRTMSFLYMTFLILLHQYYGTFQHRLYGIQYRNIRYGDIIRMMCQAVPIMQYCENISFYVHNSSGVFIVVFCH